MHTSSWSCQLMIWCAHTLILCIDVKKTIKVAVPGHYYQKVQNLKGSVQHALYLDQVYIVS